MEFAHSRNAQGQRQDLVSHLQGVAALAAEMAAAFEAGELGRWLGLWHDVGKFDPEFQAYLLNAEMQAGPRGGVDHKAAGVKLARRAAGILALAIQGHHGGLAAASSLDAWLADKARSRSVDRAIERAREIIPDLLPGGALSVPQWVQYDRSAAEMFVRLLFSALVDADFLDTEAHFDGHSALARGASVGLDELWERFARDQARVAGEVGGGAVAEVRNDVYRACLAAAEGPVGIYRLTVPTGGGKTRSAMAFALRHALLRGQRRVVVAVPFITITEQTAEVYRRIFGTDGRGRPVVLEHHSEVDGRSPEGPEDEDVAAVWRRLAAENWDASIVVTTTVQLFESLFSNLPSRVRKLHRLARSVIILDEAQSLPGHLLEPILDVLRQLSAHYGSTVIISTATQPAFEAIPAFASVPAREIVPEPERHFAALKRVEYEWRVDRGLAWGEVAELARAERQSLTVVNTRRDAMELLAEMEDPRALHLSTLLCGAHRRDVIAEVRRRLASGEACRLVSTQVVQAGVDLDFPLVLRALGPLDGIIQAAGRCNREGRLDRGRVIVFRPAEERLPAGEYRAATGVTAALLGGRALDLGHPDTARLYFERLYQTIDTDRERVQQLRQSFDYPEVARRFRMIADQEESVVVPYGPAARRDRARDLVQRLRARTINPRLALRELQPYLVSVRHRECEAYRRRGLLIPIMPGLGEWLGAYDSVRGLLGADPEAEALVV